MSGYEKIVVLSLEKWISQRRIEWGGHVFATAPHLLHVSVNGEVSDIPYISNTPKLLTDALAVNSKDIR